MDIIANDITFTGNTFKGVKALDKDGRQLRIAVLDDDGEILLDGKKLGVALAEIGIEIHIDVLTSHGRVKKNIDRRKELMGKG